MDDKHEPAGSPKGGQFAKKSGSSDSINNAIRKGAGSSLRTYTNSEGKKSTYHVNDLNLLIKGKVEKSNIVYIMSGKHSGTILTSDGVEESHSEMLDNFDKSITVDDIVRINSYKYDKELSAYVEAAGIDFSEASNDDEISMLQDDALDNITDAQKAIEKLGLHAKWDISYDTSL